jgi:hypothetical protein
VSTALIRHAFESHVTDTGDATKLGPNAWNAALLLSGGEDGEICARDSRSPTGASWVPAADGGGGGEGPAGPTGATGSTGPTGATGPTGPTGAKGDRGEPGTAGVAGAAGTAGATGAQGLTGAAGATGPQGVAGATGATGVTGAQGVIGLTGPAGATGATGAAGATGSTGPAGPSVWGGITGTLSDQADVAAALTAKSPIAGSASIVTVGSVVTGTWDASTIQYNRGGTGITASPTYASLLYGTGPGTWGILAPGAALALLRMKSNGIELEYVAPSAALVGLGNVENTALSTWVGSAAITTAGPLTLAANSVIAGSVAGVVARVGEGRACGNPVTAPTVAANGAGALTGVYQYAFYEGDPTGTGTTGLSPTVSITLTANAALVTVPLPRRGMGGRYLCRTKAGGSTFYYLKALNSQNFYQTIWPDNALDATLTVLAPIVDTTLLYSIETNAAVKFVRTHPDQTTGPADLTLITGDATSGTYSLDCYGTIYARSVTSPPLQTQMTGTANYQYVAYWQAAQNDGTIGSVGAVVWSMRATGETAITPPVLGGFPGFSLLATMPASTGTLIGASVVLTGNGSTAASQTASVTTLGSGYTGTGPTYGARVLNATAGAGSTIGTQSDALGASACAIGILARAALATQNIAVFGGIGSTLTGVGAGLSGVFVANAGTSGVDLLVGINNGVTVFNLKATGRLNWGAVQSTAAVAYRASAPAFEWGHANAAGYGCVIGAEAGSGTPYIAFNSEPGTTSNTYLTRGKVGRVITANNGLLSISRAVTASADNQTLTEDAQFNAVAFQLAAGYLFTWNGRALVGSPANGQLNVTNQAASAGVGLDVATDAVLKVRTRAQSAYATVDALAYQVGGAALNSGHVAPVVQTITLTGAQNDVALTAGCALLRVNNASLVTISGFSAGFDGQILRVISVGAGQVDFPHQSTLSVAANRLINMATVGRTPLAPGTGVAAFQYDATAARWKCVEHDQGAPIVYPYSAGDYTAATGSWTVDAGDVPALCFFLRGRFLTINVLISTTSVSAATANLRFALPQALVAARDTRGGGVGVDVGATLTNPVIYLASAGVAYIAVYKPAFSGTWGVATNNTELSGQITLDVQ